MNSNTELRGFIFVITTCEWHCKGKEEKELVKISLADDINWNNIEIFSKILFFYIWGK